jgi:hypothetical protein
MNPKTSDWWMYRRTLPSVAIPEGFGMRHTGWLTDDWQRFWRSWHAYLSATQRLRTWRCWPTLTSITKQSCSWLLAMGHLARSCLQWFIVGKPYEHVEQEVLCQSQKWGWKAPGNLGFDPSTMIFVNQEGCDMLAKSLEVVLHLCTAWRKRPGTTGIWSTSRSQGYFVWLVMVIPKICLKLSIRLGQNILTVTFTILAPWNKQGRVV